MVNLDADSYRQSDADKVLQQAEREKKRKHLKDNRRDFVPLVFSRDAIPGREANSAMRCIALRLANKWGRHYTDMMGYVKRRMGLAVIQSTTRALYGSRVPIKLVSRKPEWDDGCGLALWDTLYEEC